ncbi:MAG: PepSY-associated TM helix domain-containing protein, partial [Flavobacteriaceae bacterium]
TGVFIFWPGEKRGLKGFLVPRSGHGKRLFFRDVHAIIGFWISGLLLMVLAGAFPWTDIVGDNFKWVQQVPHTGYPKTWFGIGIESKPSNTMISLDEIVEKTKKLELPGEISISFPKGKNGVFSVGNTYHPDLSEQRKYHFDRFTGELLLQQNWSDVGVLMRGRMWVMAFHQGQFGPWNWYLMLFIAVLLTLVSISAICSYLLRKKKEGWGVPKTPKKFKVDNTVISILVVLGVLLPLFGLSLLLITAGTLIVDKRKSTLKPHIKGN